MSATAVVTVSAPPAALVSVTLAPTSDSVFVGQTLTLTPTPTMGGTGVTVTYAYESSAAAVATVNASSGVVTGVAPGTTTITVTASGTGAGYTANQLQATATVWVRALPLALTAVSLSPAVDSVFVSQTLALVPTPTVGGAGVTVTYSYASSASSVATVDTTTGVVTGVTPGAATITVTAEGRGTGYAASSRTATAMVTVQALPNALDAVSLAPANDSIDVGQTLALVPTTTIGGAGVTVTYTYESSASSVATVNTNTGVVTGVTPGTAVITVTAVGSGAGYTTTTRTATAMITVTSGNSLGVGFGLEQFSSIPTGSYSRGSSNVWPDEKPVRTIAISVFWIQKTEVTQGQWRRVMTGTALENPSFFANCGDMCPVEQVSWDDVQQFLWRLNEQDAGKGYRLPTEAEWEYAARAGTTGDFNVADQAIEALAWTASNSQNKTWPVAQKLPNAWGLYDMHGNVYEWVNDRYGSGYYATSPATDPLGPTSGTYRVLRGGSWINSANDVRSARRGYNTQYYRINLFGFRLARTP